MLSRLSRFFRRPKLLGVKGRRIADNTWYWWVRRTYVETGPFYCRVAFDPQRMEDGFAETLHASINSLVACHWASLYIADPEEFSNLLKRGVIEVRCNPALCSDQNRVFVCEEIVKRVSTVQRY